MYTETSTGEILQSLLSGFYEGKKTIWVEIYQKVPRKCQFYNSALCGRTIATSLQNTLLL